MGVVLEQVHESPKVTLVQKVTAGDLMLITYNEKHEYGGLTMMTIGIDNDEVAFVSKVLLIDCKGDAQRYKKPMEATHSGAKAWYAQYSKKHKGRILVRTEHFTQSSGYIQLACGSETGFKELL